MSKHVAELNGISKAFGKVTVLKDVSMSLSAGKFHALLGRNGAGKSTLMRILMRYEQPDSGTGSIFNHSLDQDSAKINLEIGYVSEILDYAIPVQISKVFKQVSKLYPKWDQKIFDSFIKRLQINPESYFQELSRGQKMQVAFAAAAAIQPKLIVLDEITAVLDAHARSYFMNYLSQFTKSGGTVLMATNIVSEVQHFADHLFLIDGGTIQLDLPLSELSKRFSKLRKKFGEEHEVFKDSGAVEVGLNSDNSLSYLITRARAEKYPLSDDLLDRRGITAEEIFIYYTRGQLE